jgi:hypothetical protein
MMKTKTISDWVSDYISTRQCLRAMLASGNPQKFRGEPKPRPKAAPRAVSVETAPATPRIDTQVQMAGGMTVDELARQLGTTTEELLTVLELMMQQTPTPTAPDQAAPAKQAIAKLRMFGFAHCRRIAKAKAERRETLRKAQAMRGW